MLAKVTSRVMVGLDAALIKAKPYLELVGEVADGVEVVEKARELGPD